SGARSACPVCGMGIRSGGLSHDPLGPWGPDRARAARDRACVGAASPRRGAGGGADRDRVPGAVLDAQLPVHLVGARAGGCMGRRQSHSALSIRVRAVRALAAAGRERGGFFYSMAVMLILVFLFAPGRARTFALLLPIAVGIGTSTPAVLRVRDQLLQGGGGRGALHAAIAGAFIAAAVVALVVALGA